MHVLWNERREGSKPFDIGLEKYRLLEWARGSSGELYQIRSLASTSRVASACRDSPQCLPVCIPVRPYGSSIRVTLDTYTQAVTTEKRKARRPWSRFCSQEKRKKDELCLGGLPSSVPILCLFVPAGKSRNSGKSERPLPWQKYIIDNANVYRDVYRQGFCQPWRIGE